LPIDNFYSSNSVWTSSVVTSAPLSTATSAITIGTSVRTTTSSDFPTTESTNLYSSSSMPTSYVTNEETSASAITSDDINTSRPSALTVTSTLSTELQNIVSTRLLTETDFSALNMSSILNSLSSQGEFLLSQLSPVLMTTLLNSNLDLSDCLVNCSNNGLCSVLGQAVICACKEEYQGKSCSARSSPCSYNPCLNNGTCLESVQTNNGTQLNYTCQCSSFFYGPQCENRVDLCANNSCVANQGFCKIANNTASCQCFQSYSGVNCETASAQLKTIKSVISTSSIIAIAALVLLYVVFAIMDVLHWLLQTKKKPKRKQIISHPRYIA
jgi:hypothetical protein